MKLGIIGAGNMGSAIVKGCLKSGESPSNIYIYDHSKKDLSEKLGGVIQLETAEELVRSADRVILAIKPAGICALLEEVKPAYDESKVMISIAAGVKMSTMEGMLGEKAKIVRVMPNTPAMINEAMSGLCRNRNVTEEEFRDVYDIFSGIGLAQEVPESMMDAVTGLSGSAPAFVCMFVEALADGAVLNGMPRDKAYTFAAQTVFGTAGMILETKLHPGELKDMVTSPGGTTIEGVKKLEEGRFRNSVMEAVTAATRKAAGSGM